MPLCSIGPVLAGSHPYHGHLLRHGHPCCREIWTCSSSLYFKVISTIQSGWWCNNHLEKYESQWEGWHPIYYGKIKNVWNHQPVNGSDLFLQTDIDTLINFINVSMSVCQNDSSWLKKQISFSNHLPTREADQPSSIRTHRTTPTWHLYFPQISMSQVLSLFIYINHVFKPTQLSSES
jgi:hypothetical protein